MFSFHFSYFSTFHFLKRNANTNTIYLIRRQASDNGEYKMINQYVEEEKTKASLSCFSGLILKTIISHCKDSKIKIGAVIPMTITELRKELHIYNNLCFLLIILF